MNLLQNIIYRWFVEPKINSRFQLSLHNLDIQSCIAIIDNEPNLRISDASFYKWINLQKSVMNGDFMNISIRTLNDKFMSLMKNEKNKNFAQKTLSNYSFPFNIRIQRLNLVTKNVKGDETWRTSLLSQSNPDIGRLFNWLYIQWKFNQLTDHQATMIKNLYNDFQDFSKANPAKSIYFHVLVNLINEDLNRKLLQESEKVLEEQIAQSPENKPYAFEEGRPFDFSIIDKLDIPYDSRAWLKQIEALYAEDWIHHVSPRTDDAFNVKQILHTNLARTVSNYLTMPVDLRETMRNADNLNMTELLFSNLEKYTHILLQIKSNQIEQNAEDLLKSQSVQNKLADKKLANT